MYYLNKTNFDGVSGPVKFDGANRKGLINIVRFSMESNGTEGMKSEVVGLYSPNINSTPRLQLYESINKWPSGEMPNDGRKSECRNLSVIL